MGRITVVALLYVLACAGIVGAEPPDEPFLLVRVDKLSGPQFHFLLESGFEIVARDGEQLDLVVPQSQLYRFEEGGIPYSVVEEDLAASYAARYAGREMGGFRSFMEIEWFLDSLVEARPDIVAPKVSLGVTEFFGTDIWCVKISDNPAVDEDEPEVLYVSLIHAREPAGMAALTNVMQHLAANYGVDPEITELVNTRELYFIPCQNPDGYVWNETSEPYGGGMWRKNLRSNADGTTGVDCNRNYGFMWGYDNLGSSPYGGSETYRGAGPFSEPETQAVRDFVLSHHIGIIHNFHTYSNLVIWPWGYDYQYTDREDFYAALGDSMTQYNGYLEGVGWTLYPTNGDADDWGWGDTVGKPRIISVTTEIGGSSDGFWPEPERISTLVAENLFPSLFLAEIADSPYKIAPPSPPVMRAPSMAADSLLLRWQPTDTANPATRYRLQQLQDRIVVGDDAEAYYGYWDYREMRLTDARAFEGSLSWHERVRDGECHWLELSTPYFVRPGDSLKFHIWYDMQWGFDYFYAEISADGGVTYTTLAGNLTTNDNPYSQNRGNGITGQSGTWLPAVFDLSTRAGQYVKFRLIYVTDSYSHGEGVYIDAISPLDSYGSVVTVDSLFADTVFSVPAPEGEAWFRVSATDADDQESRWSNLVAGEQGFVRGDVNGSGEVNVADLTYLVAALFRGGPDPVPVGAGDVDCSGKMNVADATMLVGVLFRGQTFPPC